MKRNLLLLPLVFCILWGWAGALSAQTVSEGQIKKLKAEIAEVKGRIDGILKQVDFVAADGPVLENDALAIPRLLQASSNLFNAGQQADEALLAILAGNFDLGFYRFAQACTSTGLSRSQVSRARFAAITPPIGLLGTFDAQFADIINELGLLRSPFPTGVGCP